MERCQPAQPYVRLVIYQFEQRTLEMLNMVLRRNQVDLDLNHDHNVLFESTRPLAMVNAKPVGLPMYMKPSNEMTDRSGRREDL